jgi:hypothetical protein
LEITGRRKKKFIERSPWLLLIAFAVVAFFAARAQAITSPYTLTSNYILFDIDNKIIYCEGQSEFIYKTLRFQAKTMRVDVKSNVMIAEGDVVVSSMATGVAIAAGAPQAAAPNAPEMSLSEEAEARLKQDVQSREGLGVQTIEGDQLRFDIDRMAGELIQSRKNVRHIYFQGESLQEVSALPVIGEGLYLYDDPSIQTNAVTAVRFRVLPDNHYEAWQTKMYVKGNKVMSLPYYTNTAKKITPGNVRLTNVKYSSEGNWGGGASYRYKETKGKQGFVDVIYAAGDSPRRYTANAKQAFQLNKRTSGGFSIGSMFSGGAGYALSLMKHGSSMRSFTADANYSKDRPTTLRFGGNTMLGKLRVRGSMYTSKMKANSEYSDQSNMNALVNVDRDTRYIGKGRKFGYNASMNANLDNQKGMDSRNSYFVGISAFRSGIALSPRSHVNMSMSTGAGADTEGAFRTSASTALRYSYNVSRGKMLNFSYNVRNGRSYGNSVSDQSVGLGFSVSQSTHWNSGISTGYDLRHSKLSDVSTSIDYAVSKKCRTWTSLIYDVEQNHFSGKNLNMTYNLYGTTVNATWLGEGNNFMIDFNSSFR